MKFLDIVTKLQIEKITVYLLFSLLIQFDMLITMTGKNVGVPMFVGEL